MTDHIYHLFRGPNTNEVTFCSWLAQAAPGDALEYHRGFLCLDRSGIESIRKTKKADALDQLADRAFDLAERGFIHLIQRRVAPETFSYIAIARPAPEGASLDFTTLMLEQAA